MSEKNPLRRPRRWFLDHLGSALTGVGAAIAIMPATARAQSAANPNWQPARHELDDWFDKGSAKHRFVFDAPSPDGFGGALLYANNYYIANQSGYGLENSDLAVVIVARHNSMPFALNDAMWAKYGAPISQQINFTDPKTKQPPSANLYLNATPGMANLGVSLDSLLKRGMQLAVCQMATRAVAGTIARAVGSTANEIYDELAANLVSNSHLVPAGIVAVNRAQERGYSFVYS